MWFIGLLLSQGPGTVNEMRAGKGNIDCFHMVTDLIRLKAPEAGNPQYRLARYNAL
jgi:hypothetical protein